MPRRWTAFHGGHPFPASFGDGGVSFSEGAKRTKTVSLHGGTPAVEDVFASHRVLIPTIISANTMARLLPDREASCWTRFSWPSSPLFAWISVGFWTSIAGLVILLTKRDSFRVTRACDGLDLSIAEPAARTAILIPIYNEDVKRVIAGLRTTFASVRQTGSMKRFDFFLLSDTTDPDVWIEEEEAWYRFCKEEDAFGRVFYRKRTSNTKRKSGNVADFCRRWG